LGTTSIKRVVDMGSWRPREQKTAINCRRVTRKGVNANLLYGRISYEMRRLRPSRSPDDTLTAVGENIFSRAPRRTMWSWRRDVDSRGGWLKMSWAKPRGGCCGRGC
jgi:hypothetical protein